MEKVQTEKSTKIMKYILIGAVSLVLLLGIAAGVVTSVGEEDSSTQSYSTTTSSASPF